MKQKQLLLLRPDDLPMLSSISGNLDLDSTTPYIKMAQDGELKRILGIDLFKKISDDFESDTLSGVYKIIYEEFVVDMLVYYSAMNIILFNSFKIDNGGIYQFEPDNANPLEMDEIDKIANRYRLMGASVELAFTDWIRNNRVEEFPNSGSCNAVNNSFKMSWFL